VTGIEPAFSAWEVDLAEREAIAAALGDLMTGKAPAPKAAVIPLVRRAAENGVAENKPSPIGAVTNP
jgi:hypothetical protein